MKLYEIKYTKKYFPKLFKRWIKLIIASIQLFLYRKFSLCKKSVLKYKELTEFEYDGLDDMSGTLYLRFIYIFNRFIVRIFKTQFLRAFWGEFNQDICRKFIFK